MAKRRPQVNFQVDEPMKQLYEEAKICGHRVTRFCAAGLLLMVEDPAIRLRALNRLRDWEAEFAGADAAQIRVFVQNAQAALQGRVRGTRPAPPAYPAKRRARPAGSE